MKVRKPQSKRTPVRLRQKIHKAGAAKERKRRKEAKQNPQWRSRLKKDPGIPNLFPYKAKVLAEIEESKRKKEEEAQRRREVAKAQRQGRAVKPVKQTVVATNGEEEEEDEDEVLSDREGDEEVDEDESMEEDDNSNPMAALLASAQARADNFSHTKNDDGDDDDSADDAEDEWNGIEDTNPTIASAQLQRQGLPKQALADPIKTVSKLLVKTQETSGGIQILLDLYKLPPLVTAGSDLTSRFLVEVARKQGRLGKGGVPNLHSAALTVLSDLNEGRLVLPTVAEKQVSDSTGKRGVKVVTKMAAPFRIEGLFGDDEPDKDTDSMVVENAVAVEA